MISTHAVSLRRPAESGKPRTQKDTMAKQPLSGIVTSGVCGGHVRVVKINGVAYYKC
jgi:hypothetical protein